VEEEGVIKNVRLEEEVNNDAPDHLGVLETEVNEDATEGQDTEPELEHELKEGQDDEDDIPRGALRSGYRSRDIAAAKLARNPFQ
jgi:hypothetical protein